MYYSNIEINKGATYKEMLETQDEDSTIVGTYKTSSQMPESNEKVKGILGNHTLHATINAS